MGAIGTKDKALAAYRQALAVRRELANQPGADEETIRDYGDSLWKTAECLMRPWDVTMRP